MPYWRLKRAAGSLHFKLTIWNSVAVIVAGIAALVAMREGVRLTLQRETDEILLEESTEIVLAITEFYPNLEEIYDELERKTSGHAEHGWFVELLDADGNKLWGSGNLPASVLQEPITGHKPFSTMVVGQYRVAQRSVDRPRLPRYTVRIGTPTEFIDANVNRLTRTMLPIGVALALLAPLGGYLLAGRATRPLQRIITTTERLRPQRLEERLPIRGAGDELDQLSEKINHFLDQIASFVARNREFVGDAAHELRSPLAAIQSSVEITLDKPRTPQEYSELLYNINDECARLSTLVNQLLLLAESDAGSLHLTHELFDLSEVVSRSLDMFQGVTEERSIDLQVQIEPGVQVHGNRVRLRQVVNNLIDNALKFTPDGGRLGVNLQRRPESASVSLEISDTGVGIGPEDLPRIFDRFYQVDKARSRTGDVRGYGLGLPICQAVVTAHQGEIKVHSVRGQGTSFTVILPDPRRRSATTAALETSSLSPP